MSQYFPPYGRSIENVRVELDLAYYATKDVDVSSYALKTNLAALKTEVDKIDTDKLKTTPDDLAKLTNIVKNDVVKKTDYNTKISSTETQIVEVNKNASDNLAEIKIRKTKIVDTSNFVTRTKLAADTNALDDKIDKVDIKIPDTSGLPTKTNLAAYLQITAFNSKITEVENKISTNDALTKVAGTKITNIETNLDGFKKSDLTRYAKKSKVADDITNIKNDYVTNASLTTRLNDLKSQHIADEVKKVDDKTKKNASDILGFEIILKQKEDTVNENKRGLKSNRGMYHYLENSYLVYKCIYWDFTFLNANLQIRIWKSRGIDELSRATDLDAQSHDTSQHLKLVDKGRMYVKMAGGNFKQNSQVIPENRNIINIYMVYQLDPIASSRNADYTIQNALFGSCCIIKNADTSKNKYEGYGICFDEGGTFSHDRRVGAFKHTTTAINVTIFGVDMSSSIHNTNKTRNISLMGKDFIQGIDDTTIYAEKNFKTNFTDPGNKFVLSLHYNGTNSYLFVNGYQELKFTEKNAKIPKSILNIGNLSAGWDTADIPKSSMYGNIYDVIVDYEGVSSIGTIYDIHRFFID